MLYRVPEFPSSLRMDVLNLHVHPTLRVSVLGTRLPLCALVKDAAVNAAVHSHTFKFDASFKPFLMQRKICLPAGQVGESRGFQLGAVPQASLESGFDFPAT